MKAWNDCEIACDCVKRANVVLHVRLCKEIFARKHTATHKPTSAQSTHMCHDDTHTHTHTPINRLWSPLAYGLGGNKVDQKTKHNFLLPDCHYMLVGPTMCGKTNTLCNMIMQWLNMDKITIYTINPDQDKYQMLAEFFEAVQEETGEDILNIDNPEDVIPVEELDDEENKVIVFDDIKIDKKNMDTVKEYFSLSRNKNNYCNCIYLCQSYFDVPKYIRRNP